MKTEMKEIMEVWHMEEETKYEKLQETKEMGKDKEK